MKKVLYFDAFNGVAGDMIVGALVDLGVPVDYLETELGKLHLDGFSLVAEKVEREGLHGVNFTVKITGSSSTHHHHHHHQDHDHHAHDDHQHEHSDHTHSHSHEHDHSPGGHSHPEHRNYADIRRLIQESRLETTVKEMALKIFHNLAKAESTVHRSELDSVHFHEVGGVDAIVDIVASAIGFHYLGIAEFYSSPLVLGSGTVTFSHGTWPVPAPATAELVRGFPTRIGTIEHEMTTPTGAAIVTALVDPSRDQPTVAWENWGFGAGDRQIPGIPNMLRLLLGLSREDESSEQIHSLTDVQSESLMIIETNIDDMDGEISGHFLEVALKNGALDAFLTPVQMKKNRPAILLSVLCTPSSVEALAELIFRETTSLGLRLRPVERWSLKREIRTVETEYGPVRVKMGRLNDHVVNVAAEFEDLKAISERSGVPLKQLRREVERKLFSGLDS